jgi:hypothetical protein
MEDQAATLAQAVDKFKLRDVLGGVAGAPLPGPAALPLRRASLRHG